MSSPRVLALVLLIAAGCAGSAEKKQTYKFVHCPECGAEMKYSVSLVGKPCASCGQKGAKLVPSISSVRNSDAGSGLPTWARHVATGVVIAVAAQAAMLGLLWYRRRQSEQRSKGDAATLRCRCPSCKRKFAYPPTKIGFSAACPRCKKQFQLPAPKPEE